MPKTIYIPKEAASNGIDITWTPSTQELRIGGWFDSICGIESESISLGEFLTRLGITEKDVRKALKTKKLENNNG
jgi:hypothetical protein